MVLTLKKNLLYIARNCPYPANDGEKVRVYNLLKQLANRYSITLVYRRMYDCEKNSRDELLRYCKQVFDVYLPPPRGHIGRLCKIFGTLLAGYPLFTSPHYSYALSKMVQEISERFRFDIVQVEHTFMFPYLDSVKNITDCIKIITLQNIDFIRLKRLYTVIPFSLRKLYILLILKKMKEYEIGCLSKFDYVLVMSDVDKELLVTNGFTGKVCVVPNGVDTEYIKPIESLTKDNTMLFVGSLDYDANRDGIMWFLKEVWPEMQIKYSDLKLYIVGRNPSREIKSYNSEKVIVTGTVESVAEYYRHARVFVVPLRSGGGTRLKILEAMAYGVPIVSTSVGCEGIRVEDGHSIMVADEVSTFAEKVGSLFENDHLCRALSKSARRLAEQFYSWKIVANEYDAISSANT